MNDITRATVIGIMIAVVLAGFAVAVLDYWPGLGGGVREKPAAPKVSIARLGPGGKPGAFFGDGLKNAVIPRSQRYDFCYGEMRVQRPAMLTTDMPTAFCAVSRQGRKGPWRISTGGWQECVAVCVRLPRP